MEQRPPREADNCSANEEVPPLSCNPKVHYVAYKSSPLDRILN